MNDLDLIRRAQAGDHDAFRLLMESYRRVLVGTAFLVTRSEGLVEDVVQEALVQAWRGLPSYRPTGSFKGWLVTILVNQTRKHHRKRRVPTAPLEEAAEVADTLDGPEEGAFREDERRRLRQALAMLNEEHREALVLRYYADLTVPEIARVLGCPEGTVKSRLSRGLDRLGGLLRETSALGWAQS
jgi:RNA polymerase sigma-70 factor (ECF subfamily)